MTNKTAKMSRFKKCASIPFLLYLCHVNGQVYTDMATKCDHSYAIDISHGVRDEKAKQITFENVTYTEDKFFQLDDMIWGCVCDVQLCITKCCIENTDKNYTCQDGFTHNVKINTYDDDLLKAGDNVRHVSAHPRKCSFYELDPMDTYHFKMDGKLHFDNQDYNLHEYCIIAEKKKNVTIVRVCFDEKQMGESSQTEDVHIYGMLVSVPFLFATLLVNLIINDGKINTRCLMAYVLCLMLSYIILIVLQFKNSMESPGCETVAAFGVYFFMATFCWMNVTCVDMYLTFSGKRGISHGTSSKWKRFALYTLFANGVPILLLSVIFGLNSREPFRGHPEFGQGQCWITDGLPLLLYFYGPMAILLIINVVLFSITALSIRKTIKHTREVLQSKESHRHSETNKQDFVLYFRIFLAMGINWSMEFISWLVDWCLGKNKVTWVWYPTDFCNAIYGIFIFFCFVWKKDVLNKLKQKYYKLLGKHHLARTFNVTTSTYTSHTERTNIDESVATDSMKMDRMESVYN